MSLRFFKSQSDFRRWLEKHCANTAELWVGFHKTNSGKPSITYKQAVDEALCYGWIDGLRKSVDETSYRVRFTPRKQQSTWSRVNIKRAGELKVLGLMKAPGLQAFDGREPKKSGIYSFENRPQTLEAGLEKQFRQNKKAWKFFETLPTYFKKTSVFWIMSAKKEETRLRRLQTFIEACARGERLGAIAGKSTP